MYELSVLCVCASLYKMECVNRSVYEHECVCLYVCVCVCVCVCTSHGCLSLSLIHFPTLFFSGGQSLMTLMSKRDSADAARDSTEHTHKHTHTNTHTHTHTHTHTL